MTYKSTRDIVRRVMPLLDQLATRSIDKARLLQYLSAAAEHSLAYPGVLPAELHDLVLAEYKRLAVDRPLSSMDERLFVHFYGHSHCDRCVYRGPGNAQIHAECFFAGYPVNFELQPPDK